MNRGLTLIIGLAFLCPFIINAQFKLQDDGRFVYHGVSFLTFHNDYYVGRKGGIELIMNNTRVASNGAIRLSPVPIPDGKDVYEPEFTGREDNPESNSTSLLVNYPHFGFDYRVNLRSEGKQIHLTVDLKGEIPDSLYGKICFMLEVYPGTYRGKSFFMDDKMGIIPYQYTGKRFWNGDQLEANSLARGKHLSIGADDPLHHFSVQSASGELEFIDGRASTNHKWLIVKELLPGGRKEKCIEWTISPDVVKDWDPDHVIGVSQIGYYTNQPKVSVIEMEAWQEPKNIQLIQVFRDGKQVIVKEGIPEKWGKYYFRNYAHFDFSDIREEGIYFLKYGDQKTEVFPISRKLSEQDYWRSTLETFIPVQMCHTAVWDRMRMWHGYCHSDDGCMVPVGHEHFDHYPTIEKSNERFKDNEHVPGFNKGGWHDAGDNDIEGPSNTSALSTLCQAYEWFNHYSDQTTVDTAHHIVRLHEPDGVNDLLQQIEHGASFVLQPYRAFGHYVRGVICRDFEVYLQMGSMVTQTDGLFYDPSLKPGEQTATHSGIEDDRWIFAYKNPSFELGAMSALARAGRALKDHNPEMAAECIETARNIWDNLDDEPVNERRSYYRSFMNYRKAQAVIELYLSTEENVYLEEAEKLVHEVFERMSERMEDTEGRSRRFRAPGADFLCSVSSVVDRFSNEETRSYYIDFVKIYNESFQDILDESPYDVPQIHTLFGTGFRFMSLACSHYYLHKKHPDIVSPGFVYDVVAYMHGNHPVSNHSLVNGVGAKSVTSAYGFNRADHSYIPGGICAGPLITRPGYIEFRVDDPFFWVQKEYTIASGTTYVLLMLAFEDLMQEDQ